MNLNCGIVGLPNVGKSTLFSALSKAKAEIANYPFCTIKPNVGIVNVPDYRLDEICRLIPTDKKVPATVEFVDIAGLVKGASKGEGLGNQFLSNIRDVGLICHVVRCFDNADIVHVSNKIHPADDINTINTELILKDLDSLSKVCDKERHLHGLGRPSENLDIYQKAQSLLEKEIWLSSHEFSDKELEVLRPLCLLSMKKQIVVCNTDEEGLSASNDYIRATEEKAKALGFETIVLCAKFETELLEIEDEGERKEILASVGLENSALEKLIQTAFRTLGLCEFFTIGKDENRAWVFEKGKKAPECAGIIHSDFEKKFIKAEVYSFENLISCKTEVEVKKRGLLRLEGKDYLMQDGDIVFFKHG